jgi:membrane protease YdiL (CAAX protease family)
MTVPQPFRSLRARALIPLTILSAIVLIAGAMLFPPTRTLAASPMGAMLILDAAIIGVLVVAAHRVQLDWDRLLGATPPNTEWKLSVVVLPLMALSYGGFWLLWHPVSFFAPDLVRSYALENIPDLLTRNNPGRLMLDIVVIVVVAPVAEEILFRGFLLHRWAVRWGMKTAVILSSAFFAILHVELIGHFFFGVVMAALYVRTQSLWMAILAHALNNGIVVALSLPAALDGAPPTTPTMEEFRGEWAFAIVSLLVGAAGLTWFWRRYGPRGAWRLPYTMDDPALAPRAPEPPLEFNAVIGEVP